MRFLGPLIAFSIVATVPALAAAQQSELRVISSARDRIASCVERDERVVAMVDIEIGTKGRVLGVTIGGDLDAGESQCVERQVGSLRFGTRDRVQRVEIPLLFHSGS